MSDTSLSRYRRFESERLHEAMFKLHDDIYFKALKRISAALKVLHELEDNLDIRQQCRLYIEEFEKMRAELEQFGTRAASFRSRLLHENGCDGTCHK